MAWKLEDACADVQVRDEMQTVKAQYETHVAGLQKKLDWHVTKQEESDMLLREQEATVMDLRARVQDMPTVAAVQQQVTDLSAQVRHPCLLVTATFAACFQEPGNLMVQVAVGAGICLNGDVGWA